MSNKPYVVTMTEIHAFEYRVLANSEEEALDKLEDANQPYRRKKILDRTIEIHEEKNNEP